MKVHRAWIPVFIVALALVLTAGLIGGNVAVIPYEPAHGIADVRHRAHVNIRRESIRQESLRRPARRGIVRACGNAVCDDDGPFPALGASLFWAGSEYRQDRAHLERNLAFLADYGFDYVRVLGEVGGPLWVDRWMDPRTDDYDATVTGLTDLAYDTYGLRIEWVIWGGTDFSVTREARRQLVDRFAQLARGREHKIMSFEIGNEAWQTGFPHPEGTQELRDLVCRLRAQVPHLVAPTSPGGPEAYGQPPTLPDGTDNWVFGYRATYEGSCATLGTVHFDRRRAEDGWRPVRLPWYYLCCRSFMPRVGFNDEPIGPGSSVASEEDPLRLVAAAAVTWVSSMASYTFHSEPGVWGGGHFDPSVGGGSRGFANLDEIPGVRTTFAGYRALRRRTPVDIVNWSPKDWHAEGHPFRGAFDAGQRCSSGTPTNCAVGLYAMTRGQDFYVPVFGIKGTFRLTASWSMRATIYALSAPQRAVDLEAGATLDLHQADVGPAVLIVGGPR